MKTVKLYENNTYLKSCEANVTAVSDEHPSDGSSEQMCTVCFDQTVFFPEGGGQSSDTGTVTLVSEPEHVFHVVDVQEQGGVVYHTLRGSAPLPEPGDSAMLTIDWPHRFDNMQRHLGEHILSGAFYRLYGAINKGFHMGDDYITIDLSFDTERQDEMGLPHFDHVTWEMAEAAELEANKVIWLDAPVTRSHFDTREEAEKLPLRKALAFDEDISIVTVGDFDDPYDCVACCGTHPSSAGQVGLIKIYKIDPNKGMSRIYLECGERAFRHYQKRLDDMYDISCELSAGTEDIKKKFDSLIDKMDSTRNRLYALTQKAVKAEADSILSSGSKTEVRSYDDFTIDDILSIAKHITKALRPDAAHPDTECPDAAPPDTERPDAAPNESERPDAAPELVILVSTKDNTAILLSGTVDCGKLIKENAPAFSGKGGGKPSMARAMFASADDLSGFIDSVKR